MFKRFLFTGLASLIIVMGDLQAQSTDVEKLLRHPEVERITGDNPQLQQKVKELKLRGKI